MSSVDDSGALEELTIKYNLDCLDTQILSTYLNLPESQRQAFRSFMVKMTPETLRVMQAIS
jgi:hypothetical protein